MIFKLVVYIFNYNYYYKQFSKEINDGFELLNLIGKDLNLNLNNDELTDGTVRYVRNNENEFQSHELKIRNGRRMIVNNKK